jgi:hypothetical protein
MWNERALAGYLQKRNTSAAVRWFALISEV